LDGEGVKIRRRGKKSIYLDDQLGGARKTRLSAWRKEETTGGKVG
jgi:hypothetical protein